MKKLLLPLALLLIVISAAAQESKEYTDSLTGVKLSYSANYDITLMDGFQKAVISTPKTDINIYSKVSKKGKQFSWEEINEFDSKNAYGKLLRYDRTPNELDGWIRYYSNKTSKGRPYTACVILIRGKDYAFYMTEAAYDEADLLIVDMLQTAEFPKSKRESKTAKKRAWIILAILFAAPLALFKPLKQISEKAQIALMIISMAAATLVFLFFTEMSLFGIYVTVLEFIPWIAVISSSSFKDAFKNVYEGITKALQEI